MTDRSSARRFLRGVRTGLSAVCIVIAVTSVSLPASSAEIVHVVAKGQTLGRIAKRYHTTVELLREANGLRKGARLLPGQSLVIPEKGKVEQASRKAADLRGECGDSKDRHRGKRDDVCSRASGAKHVGGHDDEKLKPVRFERQATDRSFARTPRRPGTVKLVRGSEKLETQLLTRHGRLVPSALPRLSRMLRSASGSETSIDPRLATLLGMVSDHFGGRVIRITSGYRPFTEGQYTPHSNHNLGRAVDFAIEGVPNTVVRDYCRTFRNAGVGYYPNSTFVHLDVRGTKTYWIDYSGPGEAPRYDRPRTRLTEAPREERASDVEVGSTDTPPPPPQNADIPGRSQDTDDILPRDRP